MGKGTNVSLLHRRPSAVKRPMRDTAASICMELDRIGLLSSILAGRRILSYLLHSYSQDVFFHSCNFTVGYQEKKRNHLGKLVLDFINKC